MIVRPFLAGMIMGQQNLRSIEFYEKSSCQVDRIVTSTGKHERAKEPKAGRGLKLHGLYLDAVRRPEVF